MPWLRLAPVVPSPSLPRLALAVELEVEESPPREIELDCADRLVAAWNELALTPLLEALEVLAMPELSPEPPVWTLGALPEELPLLPAVD